MGEGASDDGRRTDVRAVPESNRFPTRVVGPVLQFSLLIMPVVMNSFYLVYALLGLLLEGRDLLNWSIEAAPNAPWVCAVILGYCALTALFAIARGARFGHALVVSSLIHAALALALTVLILATVRL